MNSLDNTYSAFYIISTSAYKDKIRFFEKYEEEIQSMDFIHQSRIYIDYGLALFQIGNYREFLEHADFLIECVVMNNIYRHDGERIFESLLWCKAASKYHLGELLDSEYIISELMKIEPQNVYAPILYKKIQQKKLADYKLIFIGLGIGLLLLALGIAGIHMLIIEPFYEMYTEISGLTWKILLLLAAFSIAMAIVYPRLIGVKKLLQFYNKQKE